MGQKVAVDTNVFISALGWDGTPEEALNLICRRGWRIAMSNAQLEEVGRVLDYPQFRFSSEDKRDLLRAISHLRLPVEPGQKTNLLSGPADDILLQTALAAGASYLITGDQEILALRRVSSVEMLSPREFLVQCR